MVVIRIILFSILLVILAVRIVRALSRMKSGKKETPVTDYRTKLMQADFDKDVKFEPGFMPVPRTLDDKELPEDDAFPVSQIMLKLETPAVSGGIPLWAEVFTREELDYFLDMAGAYFTRRGKTAEIMAGEGVLTVPGDEIFGQRIGLHNLAQMCARHDRAHWARIISLHFDCVEKTFADESDLERKKEDFEQVEALLHARIYPMDYAGNFPSFLVFRTDLPGTATVLVYDLPSSIKNVRPEDVKPWGKGEEELMRTGLANVRKNYPPEIGEHEFPDGVKIKFFSGENFFITSHALLLEHYPEVLGSYGTIIGIPNRHTMICHLVEGMEVKQAIPAMITMVRDLEKKGPGSITTSIFWYRDGRFFDIPYQFEDDSLQISPPPELVEILGRIEAENGAPRIWH